MEFFNNTSNDVLKFKLNSEGININKIEPRLILTTPDNKTNYFFIGRVREDICEFHIPELKLYEKDDRGKIKFEIISEDLYFPVWEDEFKVVSKASIKIEEVFVTEHKQNKPKITTNIIREKSKEEEYDDEINLKALEKQKSEQRKIFEHKKIKARNDFKNVGFKKFSNF